jgi:4-carboxymuconolactone decarboxylase
MRFSAPVRKPAAQAANARSAANGGDDMTDSISRIQDIPPEQLTPEQNAVLEDVQAGRGFLPAPYRVWLHHSAIAERMERLGTYLNKRGLLSEREFEIGIVVVGQQLDSPYVINAHLNALVRTNHPAEVVDAMRERRRPTFATERETVIYDIAMNTYDPQPAPDELFDRATRILGRDGLAELIVLIGYYTSVALAMKMHRVPVPAK